MCGASLRTLLFKQRGRDPYLEIVFGPSKIVDLCWYVCDRCGFVYRSPILDEAEMAKLYSNYEADVFKDCDPDEYFDKIVAIPDADSENVQKTIWLGDILREHIHNQAIHSLSVLDVGCGGGTLLHTMCEKLSFGELCAVELNKAYADLAKRRLNADVRNQKYEPGLFNKSFDLVVCAKVLEHVIDPEPFLSALAEDLAEDGLLFVEVPDVSDMYTLPPDHERFYIPHVYYFSCSTLGVMLGSVGLKVLSNRNVVTHRGRSYLQIVARRGGPSEPPLPPYDHPTQLAEHVSRFQPRISGKKIV